MYLFGVIKLDSGGSAGRMPVWLPAGQLGDSVEHVVSPWGEGYWSHESVCVPVCACVSWWVSYFIPLFVCSACADRKRAASCQITKTLNLYWSHAGWDCWTWWGGTCGLKVILFVNSEAAVQDFWPCILFILQSSWNQCFVPFTVVWIGKGMWRKMGIKWH